MAALSDRLTYRVVIETRCAPPVFTGLPLDNANQPLRQYLQDETKPGNLHYSVDDDQDSLDFLVQGGIKPAPGVFVDEANLRAFGVYGEIYALLSSAGFRTPLTSLTPCYEPLVYEFYSTFFPTFAPMGGIDGWGFQIGGQEFTYSKNEICGMLDIPTEYNDQVLAYGVDLKYDFWKKITGEDYTYGWPPPPASKIKSPIWKVIHALIARNITSECDGSVVTGTELHVLTAIDMGLIPDWFRMLTDLFKLRGEYVHSLRGGHFITRIATRLGFNFNMCRRPLGLISVLKLELLRDGVRADEWERINSTDNM